MPAELIYPVAGVALFSLGLYALLLANHLIRRLMALNVSSSGVSLLLVATAKPAQGGEPDPIPQALVLTGIVVLVSATGLGLALYRKIEQSGGVHPDAEQGAELPNRLKEGI